MILTVGSSLSYDYLQMTVSFIIPSMARTTIHLQTDLDLIVKWTETWQMNLNIDKCAILTCSRLLSSSTSVYTINGQSITRVTQHPYLGVMFDSTMSFSSHISNITCNAMRTLNFVKRNLYKCNGDTKCMAYTSLVRPVLEYASSVWDPHLNKNILAIEMVEAGCSLGEI